MIEIIFNNDSLDLYDDTRVPLNFKASLAESIGEYIANYSNTFEAPATDHNLGLVENANLVASNSRIPYRLVECKLLINGRDLFGISRLIILDIGVPTPDAPGSMRLAFIAGRGATTFGGSIRELDLSAHNFVYNAAQAAARAANTSGVLFAPVNYGVDLLTSQVDINFTHFSVYAYTILGQMFDEAGVAVEIVHQTSTFFQRIVIPVYEPKQLIVTPADFIAQRTGDVGFPALGTAQTIIFNTVLSGNDAGYYNPATGVFTYPQPSKFSASAKVRIRAPLNGASVAVTINNQAGSGITVQQVSDGVTDLEFDVDLPETEVYSATTWRVQVICNSVAFTVRGGSTFALEVSEDFVEGQTIDVARSLPDMAQTELFAQIAKLANLIVTTRDGVVRLMAFDRLAVSDRVDWSKQYDARGGHQILFQSRFGRSTYFRYSNDSFSPSATTGEAVVNFDNDVLQPSADAIKLLFAGAIDRSMSGTILSILIPRYALTFKDGSGTAGRNGGAASTSIIFTDPHKLKVGDYIFIVDLGITYYVLTVPNTTLVTVYTGGGGLPNFSASAWQVAVIAKNNINPRIGYVPEGNATATNLIYRGRSSTANVTSVRQVVFNGPIGSTEGLHWATLLKNYFLLWLGAMERFQLVRAWMKLRDNDVYQFDFTTSVYIEKMGSEFYVQSINQYDGDEDSTEVEILALAEALDSSKITAL